MTQFSMIDSATRPQRLAISWSMETPRDDSAGAPDTMQDGFWPSLDPEDAGFIGEGKTAADLKRERAKAQLRMNRWTGDAWHYVGVVARAVVFIPAGGQSFRVLDLRSAGLWGIESDAGAYLREVYEEQKADLRRELDALAAGLTSGDLDEEESD
jgi:hypothetical protein